MKPVPKKIMDELRAAQDKYIANDPNWDGGSRSTDKQSLANLVEFWDSEINTLTPENPKLAAFSGVIGGAAGTALGCPLYGISGLNAIPFVLAGAGLTAAILYRIVKYENAQIKNLHPNLQIPAEQEFAKVQSITGKYAPELMEE
jgi:hypothetical protein